MFGPFGVPSPLGLRRVNYTTYSEDDMCADDPIASHEQIEEAWKKPYETLARIPDSNARQQAQQYLDLSEQWAHSARESMPKD